MKKFKCTECIAECELTLKTDEFMPHYCLSDKEEADWHEVKEVYSAKNAQPDVEAKQLPEWVKIGAVGYDAMNNEYFEITHIENDSFRAKSIDSSNSCSSLYFNEFVYEANKRPFNDAEMKALVGKILTHKETGDLTLVTDFINHYDKDLDLHYGTVFAFDDNYTDGDLMTDCTLDGKPCYVLEHLNEKGEWVK